jgi:hypothetical protein
VEVLVVGKYVKHAFHAHAARMELVCTPQCFESGDATMMTFGRKVTEGSQLP